MRAAIFKERLRRLLFPISITLSCWSLAAAGVAGSSPLDEFLAGLDTLQADFEQTVFDTESNRISHAWGTFYLQRPDRFRWDYTRPELQEIVADGRQVWLYDPELNQVSVQFQSQALRGTPALLLASADPVENSFQITDKGEGQGLAWLELIPRERESQFVRILLGFADNQLRRMELDDQFGQTSEFRFSAIRRNPDLPSTLFFFEPPLDSDLYNQ